MRVRYPLTADLRGKRCLVVGGGKVATRKVEGLLETGAAIRLVAPRITQTIGRWAEEGRLSLELRPFSEEDAAGAVLVFAAADDPEVNREVALAAKSRGAWVNVADDPPASDFFVPALHRKGRVTLAVSTEGASPAFAAWLRDRAGAALPEGTERLSALLAVLRRTEKGAAPFGAWQNLFESGILHDLAGADDAAAKAKWDGFFGPGAWDRVTKAMEEEQ